MRQITSIRERQTQLSNSAIIEAAQSLFISNGYARTTVQDIADASGVGPATVYRHFGSKLGVFLAIARRDIDEVFAEMRKLLAAPQSDAAEAVADLLCAALAYTDKPVSRIETASRFWLLFPTGEESLDRFVTESDKTARAMIDELLTGFRSSGQLREDIAVSDMAEILFHLFNASYITWNLNKSIPLNEVASKLRQQISLIFESWRT